jgi:hypothetical protein
VYFLSHLKAKQREQRQKENAERIRLQKDEERSQKRNFDNEWKQRQKDIRRKGEMRHQVFMEYIQNVREQKIEYVMSAEEERRRKRMDLTVNQSLSIPFSFPQNPRSVHYQLQTNKIHPTVQTNPTSCPVEEPNEKSSDVTVTQIDTDLNRTVEQKNECFSRVSPADSDEFVSH